MRRLDENVRIKLDDIKITKEDLDKINKVYIVACSTAYHAGVIGKYAIEKFAGQIAEEIKEISYVHAEAFAVGELKHGSIALIDKGTPVVAIAT